MKKYILPFMSIIMLMTMASCSSSDDVVAENNTEGKLVQMTFTATQESNVGTRTELGTGNSVVWESGDKISVFDGSSFNNNHEFTLDGDGGSTLGSFTGTAESTPSTCDYYAVYPYNLSSTLDYNSDNDRYYVSGITLPSTQTAIKDSFDPKAALMIAKSSDKTHLDFQNVVSLVKVTTDFPCKRIVLNATHYIAGQGRLYFSYPSEEQPEQPKLEFNSLQSMSIVLIPEEGKDEIEAGTYYIAVNPGTSGGGWSISFTSTDYNVYTRVAYYGVQFNRGKIRGIGTFNIASTPWTSTSRGDIVTAEEEVDLGLTITKEDGKKYRVIFAKSNLTANGLADNESDYGDYFAWGAIKPWYNSYFIRTDGTPIVAAGNWEKLDGYTRANAPILSQTYYENDVLSSSDDTARQILGGDWQLPTTEIWDALYNANKETVYWGNNGNMTYNEGEKGMRITRNDESGSSLFLPAAGSVDGTSFYDVGSFGYYWSGTAYSSSDPYSLFFYSGTVYAQNYNTRYYGFSVRPVRLVAVD